MSNYIETSVGDQAIIQIEVSDKRVESLSYGTVEKATPLSLDQMAEKARDALNLAFENIRTLANEFGKKFIKLSETPEEMTLSFGIKIDASANAFVAKAGSEAQFQVTITWKRLDPPKAHGCK
jgi:hypothetical protein